MMINARGLWKGSCTHTASLHSKAHLTLVLLRKQWQLRASYLLGSAHDLATLPPTSSRSHSFQNEASVGFESLYFPLDWKSSSISLLRARGWYLPCKVMAMAGDTNTADFCRDVTQIHCFPRSVLPIWNTVASAGLFYNTPPTHTHPQPFL